VNWFENMYEHVTGKKFCPYCYPPFPKRSFREQIEWFLEQHDIERKTKAEFQKTFKRLGYEGVIDNENQL